jgi:hypothetical protein
VHGLVYALRDGLLRDLGASVAGDAELAPKLDAAVARLAR